jgi:hypothetical protein
MEHSRKYGRTYHYPFSPGTTSDDRFNYDWWTDLQRIPQLIHTEKLDGENNCISARGVFARSHAAPTVSPWTAFLREKWQRIRRDLGNLEIFGENMYAIHSIGYEKLEHHYYVFAIREHDQWLSWEETCFYAGLLDFPTVPVIGRSATPTDMDAFTYQVKALATAPSELGSYDPFTGHPCTREGVVTRNAAGYPVEEFVQNVFKYVRKGHVKTDEHWTRNWKRAPLSWERRTP